MSCIFEVFSKETRFLDLINSVQHCKLCRRLADKKKILSEANGNYKSEVLFIAEAPGRLGADRTGIPLFGDRTGDNFELLLNNIGWKREDIFITNAILCNPQDDNGTNGTPTLEEIANCSAYLEMVISLVQPSVIATLGANALKALANIVPHHFSLKENVAKISKWKGYILFPLYHPGPRAIIHRSISKQTSDFIALANLVHPINGIKRRSHSSKQLAFNFTMQKSSFHQVVRALLELNFQLPYFKLAKLLYLLDMNAIKQFGHTVASEIYIRQKDGPWPPKLNEVLISMDNHEISRLNNYRIPKVKIGPSPRFDIELEENVLALIAEISAKYSPYNNSEIKTAVYNTRPMRFILKKERVGEDMLNKPVLYKDKFSFQL